VGILCCLYENVNTEGGVNRLGVQVEMSGGKDAMNTNAVKVGVMKGNLLMAMRKQDARAVGMSQTMQEKMGARSL